MKVGCSVRRYNPSSGQQALNTQGKTPLLNVTYNETKNICSLTIYYVHVIDNDIQLITIDI